MSTGVVIEKNISLKLKANWTENQVRSPDYSAIGSGVNVKTVRESAVCQGSQDSGQLGLKPSRNKILSLSGENHSPISYKYDYLVCPEYIRHHFHGPISVRQKQEEK